LIFATDCYFHIGQAHLNGGKPCQDYACASVYQGAVYAIVSDGCTTGGETDVGARVLTLSTAVAIREHWAVSRTALGHTVPQEIGMRQKIAMAGSREILGLDQQDMLATCVYQYITPDGGFIHLQGDGVLARKERNGRITMCRYEWMPDSEGHVRPLYPAYAADGYASFIQAHGGDINEKRLTKECWEYSPDGELLQLPSEEFTLGEGIRGITTSILAEDMETTDCTAVFSDGVTQIESLDWKDAVVGLLAFKTTEGEFAKRRMIRVIRDAQKDSKGPLDDIAYAVVRVIASDGDDET